MKRVRECVYGGELDLQTLVWTRGRDFPLARLESRLKCPRCGSRRVRLAFGVPATPLHGKARNDGIIYDLCRSSKPRFC